MVCVEKKMEDCVGLAGTWKRFGEELERMMMMIMMIMMDEE